MPADTPARAIQKEGMEVTIQRYYSEGRLVADNRGGLVNYADHIEEIQRLEADLAQWEKWGIVEIAVRNPQVAEYVEHWESRALRAEAEIARLRANNMGVKYEPQQPKAAVKPPVIHVVTPESSSGKLWAEIQRLQAVEAESARTIAHLNQTHREVSEIQKARIEELESVLAQIGDCREHPQCTHARLARKTIAKSAGLEPEAL